MSPNNVLFLFLLISTSLLPSIAISKTLQDFLVAEYLFEDTTDLGKDTSGNNHHLTTVDLIQGTGRFGQSAEFNGSSSRAFDLPGFSKGEATTFTFWFKAASGQGGYLFEQSYWTSGGKWWYLMPAIRGDNGYLEVWAYGHDGGRDDINITVNQDFRNNQWQMVSIVTNGESLKVYVGYQLKGQQTFSRGPESWEADSPTSKKTLGYVCQYGRSGCSGSTGTFNGQIDEVRIFNKGLGLWDIYHINVTNHLNRATGSWDVQADNIDVIWNTETTVDVLANDQNTDSDASLILSTQPANGTLRQVASTLYYTPNHDYVGTDTFTYYLETPDYNKSEEVTVNLNVQQAPHAIPDTFTVYQDSSNLLNILGNDSDEDLASVLINVSSLSANGATLSVENQQIKYTSAPGFSGNDSFIYSLTDSSGLDSEAVTVNVRVRGLVPNVLLDHLVAEYLFEDADDLGKDSSGNNYHLTTIDLVQSNGKFGGKSAVFNGGSSRAYDLPGFNKGEGTTFTFWFKAAPDQGGFFFEQSYWTSEGKWWYLMPAIRGDNGYLEVWAYGNRNGARDDINITVNQDYRDNQWRMVTIVTNGESLKLYVDQQLKGEDLLSNGPVSWDAESSTSKKTLGYVCQYGSSGCAGSTGTFNGQIDEFRIFSKGFDGVDVNRLHNNNRLFWVTNVWKPQADNLDVFWNVESYLDVGQNDLNSSDTASTVIANNPGNGSLRQEGNAIYYTPNPDFYGQDEFTYYLEQGTYNRSETVTVTINVQRQSISSLKTGLIAEYLFDDVNNFGLDTSGQGKHAVASGDILSVAGMSANFGRAANFVQGELSGFPGFDKGEYATYNFWFSTVYSGNFFELSFWNDSGVADSTKPSWSLMPGVNQTTGAIEVTAYGQGENARLDGNYELTGDQDDLNVVVDDLDYRQGTWHMLTIITNGTSGKVYLNGEFKGEDSYSSGPSFWDAETSQVTATIGKICKFAHQSCTSPTYLYSMLDDFRVYNRALTPSEVQALHTNDLETVFTELQPDEYWTEWNQAIDIDVLENDARPASASLIFNQPQNGSLTQNPDGSLHYVPNTNYYGADTFTYHVRSIEGVDSELVTVTVNVEILMNPAVLNDLAVELLFDDSENFVLDTSGQNVQATHQNLQSDFGRFGKGLKLDGNQNRIDGLPGFNKGDVTTFNLWFKVAPGGGGYLMEQSYWNTGGDSTSWNFMPHISMSDGYLRAWAMGNILETGRDDVDITRAVDFRDNQWHMLTVVTDGNFGRIYIDGVYFNEDISSNGPVSWSANQANSLRRLGWACPYGYDGCAQGSRSFVGMLDDYRMLNRELSASEILNLYANSVAKVSPTGVADDVVLDWNTTSSINVLDNDIKPAGSTIVITQPTNGSASLTADSTLILYTPNQDFLGSDQLTYQIRLADGNIIPEPIQVSINVVNGTAEMPTLRPTSGDDTRYIDAGKTTQEILVTTDVPGATIYYSTHQLDTQTFIKNQLYTGPVVIDKTTGFFAWVEAPGFRTSDKVFKNYIMCAYELALTLEDLEGYTKDQLDNRKLPCAAVHRAPEVAIEHPQEGATVNLTSPLVVSTILTPTENGIREVNFKLNDGEWNSVTTVNGTEPNQYQFTYNGLIAGQNIIYIEAIGGLGTSSGVIERNFTVEVVPYVIQLDWQSNPVRIRDEAILNWEFGNVTNCQSEFSDTGAIAGTESKYFYAEGTHSFQFDCHGYVFKVPVLEVQKLSAPSPISVQ